jgi:hypothetical protein
MKASSKNQVASIITNYCTTVRVAAHRASGLVDKLERHIPGDASPDQPLKLRLLRAAATR